jgi:peptide/nickel transport system substrate-binding protein
MMAIRNTRLGLAGLLAATLLALGLAAGSALAQTATDTTATDTTAQTPAVAAGPPIEPPMLAEKVAAGELPPIEQRLPLEPARVPLDGPEQGIGRHGGDLTMLMGSAKDTRMMVVYGYARLVAYDRNFNLVPDILKSFEVEDGRIFTFHLRSGHKWSDGKPFTTEDFRYWWEDVANNTELSPTGPPNVMLVNGMPPTVEFLDETTVRYTWPMANADFLPALAGPSPLYIFRPAHYLKKYHQRYADAAELAQAVTEGEQPSWAALHNRKDNLYKNDNPKQPTLEPWMLTTKPPSERFVFERNPYYYRVDAAGRQLPYLDRFIFQIADGKIIPAKTGAGEADLQARNLRFDNYTFLKAGESAGGYHVRLWDSVAGSKIALYPNLNIADPVWRTLLHEVLFRRALSLAIDRHEINQVIYFGLGREGANTVLPGSPLYRAEYQGAWAQYDPDRANRMLDDLGLIQRDGDGIRLMPDGRPLDIIVETAGESSEELDVLELIRDSWSKIGVRLFSKPSQREVFRNRIFAGETIMSVWTGLENGLATPDMAPLELAPTTQQQLMWPQWGQFVETGGEAGEATDMAPVQTLAELLRAWRQAPTREARTEIWGLMLSIFTDQVFVIGTVAAVPQPVVVRDTLRNVPEKGVYSWDPGAHFGFYKPDTFWFADAPADQAATN